MAGRLLGVGARPSVWRRNPRGRGSTAAGRSVGRGSRPSGEDGRPSRAAGATFAEVRGAGKTTGPPRVPTGAGARRRLVGKAAPPGAGTGGTSAVSASPL